MKKAAKNSGINRTNSGLAQLYPVGSIYLSVNDTNPGTFIGGTWERIKDRFLLAAGDSYAAGSTGGEAKHKLSVEEMPSHNHDILKGMGYSENEFTPGMSKANYKSDKAYADTKNDDKYYWQAHTEWAGNSVPHNNMPPYIAVYMWVRTA